MKEEFPPEFVDADFVDDIISRLDESTFYPKMSISARYSRAALGLENYTTIRIEGEKINNV